MSGDAARVGSTGGVGAPSARPSDELTDDQETMLGGLSEIGPGSRSPDVATLQTLLQQKGFPVSPTGTFDAATAKAVKDFQSKRGLESKSGLVGQQTWAALNGFVAPPGRDLLGPAKQDLPPKGWRPPAPAVGKSKDGFGTPPPTRVAPGAVAGPPPNAPASADELRAARTQSMNGVGKITKEQADKMATDAMSGIIRHVVGNDTQATALLDAITSGNHVKGVDAKALRACAVKLQSLANDPNAKAKDWTGVDNFPDKVFHPLAGHLADEMNKLAAKLEKADAAGSASAVPPAGDSSTNQVGDDDGGPPPADGGDEDDAAASAAPAAGANGKPATPKAPATPHLPGAPGGTARPPASSASAPRAPATPSAPRSPAPSFDGGTPRMPSSGGAPNGVDGDLWHSALDSGLTADQKKMLAGMDPKSPEYARAKMQAELQNQQEIAEFISNMLKLRHDTMMAIIANMR